MLGFVWECSQLCSGSLAFSTFSLSSSEAGVGKVPPPQRTAVWTGGSGRFCGSRVCAATYGRGLVQPEVSNAPKPMCYMFVYS